ncbi:MAG TPA: hypothetical protein PK848_07075 [Caldisericia bacterium]|nr:hypothetical protein [Caldisericia bacterium]HOG70979.1 hypothetical protein [Caldisericia bacterium]HPM43784.1 hypothetical protein [Caldisericia bacterium]HPV86517.1 hypothetical protein [Caldisericia bacterium]
MKWIVNPMDEFVINCTQQQCSHHKCVQNQCNPADAYCTGNSCVNVFDDVGEPCAWACSKTCVQYCPDHVCDPPEGYTGCYTNQVCPAGWETTCPTLQDCPSFYP